MGDSEGHGRLLGFLSSYISPLGLANSFIDRSTTSRRVIDILFLDEGDDVSDCGGVDWGSQWWCLPSESLVQLLK